MKKARREAREFPGGDRIFQRMYTRLGCQGRPPQFHVQFHPYTDLTLTIRIRDDVAYVRMSDALQDAPATVVEAAAALLLARLYRRKAPRELLELYRRFSYEQATRDKLRSIRQRRARRTDHQPAGAHFDLDAMFDRLNAEYFQGALRKPRLGWSRRSWRSQLGCFDPALDQIVLNRLLDRPGVPDFAVAYVLYHEMLHVKHPMKFARCRRESHTAEFRREEKRFSDYARASRYLDRSPGRATSF
ncbi:MAG TPA: SprT-like domain-containing protein [Verrucomicrobiae bacterium]|nr:SprT-like domain-containing protein [Verrucomicrobiae bacterium]